MRAERREHRRFDYQARCWCQHPRASQYVTILNASLGGLFVKTHTPFAAGEVMEVLWSAEPGKPNLRAVAKVMWRRGHAAPDRSTLLLSEAVRSHAVPTEYRATVGRGESTCNCPGMGLAFVSLPAETEDELTTIEEKTR